MMLSDGKERNDVTHLFFVSEGEISKWPQFTEHCEEKCLLSILAKDYALFYLFRPPHIT
jgi:hypothetical protein